MKGWDVYKAAVAGISKVEDEFGKGERYWNLVQRVKEIESMLCRRCEGWGWTNPDWAGHGEIALQNPKKRVKCQHCYGSGFQPDGVVEGDASRVSENHTESGRALDITSDDV
jgi:hypothetical protein